MPIDTHELMKQVSRIRVFTNKIVNEQLSGEYLSVFKGQGIEFDEVREYVPGDDIRAIDWNVTARMGHPFVKRFCEERELTIIFMVDISGSQCFGSKTKSKAELAAEITCLLALSAIKNQDKVGLLLFSDRIEKFIPPRKGRKAAIRLVREVLAAAETRRNTNIASALRFINNVQKRKAVIFLISDFISPSYTNELRVTAKRHDVICCYVYDPLEKTLPTAGIMEIEDPETGELYFLDTDCEQTRKIFKEKAEQEEKEIKDLFTRFKIDHLNASTDKTFIDDLRKLFHKRQLRVSHGR